MRIKPSLLLLAACSLYTGALHAQCTPIDSFDTGFDNFTAFPDSCWSHSGTPGLNFYLSAAQPSGQELVFYGSTSVGNAFYLVTPELTTIDGNHYLTFDAKPFSALALGVKIQVGTLESATGYTTFVPQGNEIIVNDTVSAYTSILVPANASYKHIALRLTTVSPHQAVKLDNMKWQAAPTPPLVCNPVSALNQGFDHFTAFPDSCWTASHTYPNFYLDETTADKEVTFYASSEANTAFYLTTPELSDIDGNHVLKFKGTPLAAGSISIQVGTLADNADYSTFTAQGSVITVNGGNETEYTSIAIPANANYKYVTLKITPSAAHQAMNFDDFKWETAPVPPTGIHEVAPNAAVKFYPNPAAGDKLTIEMEEVMEQVLLLDASGRQVAAYRPQSAKAELNIAGLQKGLYFVQVSGRKGNGAVKFIKQ